METMLGRIPTSQEFRKMGQETQAGQVNCPPRPILSELETLNSLLVSLDERVSALAQRLSAVSINHPRPENCAKDQPKAPASELAFYLADKNTTLRRNVRRLEELLEDIEI